MKRRCNSLILGVCLTLLMTTASYAQSYTNSYDNSFFYEAEPSADSSWKSTQKTGYQTYTVKSGDTLGSISQKFFGTTTKWKLIASANNISDSAKIKVGQIIDIPITDMDRGEGTLIRHKNYENSQKPNYDFIDNYNKSNKENYISASSVYGNIPSGNVGYGGAIYEDLPPVKDLPPITNNITYFDSASTQTTTNLSLPPVTSNDDTVLYSGSSLPQITLPGDSRKHKTDNERYVTTSGLTGLINTFSAYPLGKNVFSIAAGMSWNKINKKDGNLLQAGEDGDQYEFPIVLTYAGENFEVAFKIPFQSYDIYAPVSYNFRDGSDSGMDDCELRFKFTSENEDMASCLGLGCIFPTSDIAIGNTDSTNAWEMFAGLSTKRKDGGNIHLNAGYQAGDGKTAHEGVYVNVGYDYRANESFTFIGEVNFFEHEYDGKSTDLLLGLRYHVKPGMALSLSAPIALTNTRFFGYDYKIQGMLQYHY